MWTPNRLMFLRRYICEWPNIININHERTNVSYNLAKANLSLHQNFALLNLFCYHEKKFLIMTN
jgi:hypothetical protein